MRMSLGDNSEKAGEQMDTIEPGAMHVPVMAAEALADLAPEGSGRYLDGTLGLGGHAENLLARAPLAEICGLDRDSEALALARQRLARFGDRCHFFHLCYPEFPSACAELGWDRLNGAMLDLGVSSLQLDSAGRGFSFRLSGPLDMRMDRQSCAGDAADFVNHRSWAELRDCLALYGEEPQAGRIARRIVEERQKAPITDTERLAAIVWEAYPAAWRRSARRHPATRTFQALRMAVNDEPGQLASFLEKIPAWLAPGARLVIISFHSIEDRLVKQAMRSWAKAGKARILHKKPLSPQESELAANPRARSAKLRCVEMLPDDDSQ